MTFDYLFAFSVLFFSIVICFTIDDSIILDDHPFRSNPSETLHCTVFIILIKKKKLHSAFDIHYASSQDTFYAHNKYISGSVPTYEMKKKKKLKLNLSNWDFK